ncbi:YeiH family protein [Brevibacillus fulvus]|uniref:Integral membrane protein (TIGR00698 family) n=1 Tax=Brevibacillus fulvus TaxID=1125967 RepID=A0A939BU24_9BACL|nr:putative sulfate exporter family transporter [Brevibacillus fulvus]MBM7592098.1 putative integral membrane protein (TIGR00698 family) [Brevibacillus fulvus]
MVKQLTGSMPQPHKNSTVIPWIGGVLFTFIIAWIGYGLSLIPGVNRLGPLACAILVAVVYRQLWGYPEPLRPGIQYTAKKLLRLAIILYGLRLNISVVLDQGVNLLLYGAGTIVFALAVTLWLARRLKADPALCLLLAVGTGVCGAAAIAAVSPLIKAKEEDTAIGVGIIALVGTLFALCYTLVRPLLPISPVEYGIWSGVSLHELAHVALAAAPAGQDGLAIALLAKLGRVLLLVPLCFVLMVWMRRFGKTRGQSKVEFPWFLLGFIAMSIIGSYVFGPVIHVPESLLTGITSVSSFILTMAMVGLGLNVDLHALRTKAARPLLAMLLTSILLSLLSYLVIA